MNNNNNVSNVPSNANEECVGPTSKTAGKAASCAGCPNQQECASGKYAGNADENKQSTSQILARLENVKHILLVLSGKGGVGKSTIASQLAWSLQYYGYDVGVLDIDICGPSMARMMGVESEQVHKSQFGWTPVYRKNNLSVMSVAFLLSHKHDAIIWRGPRKNALIKQFLVDVEWQNLDFLIIDCPPGTSDEHISIAQLLAARKQDVHAIVVTTPQEMSLLDVRKEISFANKVGLNILGVIENMSGFMCPCCNKKTQIFKASTGGAKALCTQMNVDYLGSVPIDQLLLQCCENGKSYLKYSASHTHTQSMATHSSVFSSNDGNQATQGTRVAVLNVLKQITSRIEPTYAEQIEQKEALIQSRLAHKRNKKKTHHQHNHQMEMGNSPTAGGVTGGDNGGNDVENGGNEDDTTDSDEEEEEEIPLQPQHTTTVQDAALDDNREQTYAKHATDEVDVELTQHMSKLDDAT
eukprot:CAMPEP_0202693732 /NCGR_PEP_ID=MMETSP1385-20130828/7766_1 /ASSEMBLY_ACC=CAM_ASM_000861 /TAXON_ID=933848 /ORGANISM="Elphidium margaritaceum" /LENGTH=467 /DNA_ID=CAMNT_0049349453 /DNA_START=21 /DNA_END=1420 /DNA_ORIENTATION=+